MQSKNNGIKRRIFLIAGLVCWVLFTAANGLADNDPDSVRGQQNTRPEQVLKSIPEEPADFPVYLYFTDNTNQYLVAEEWPVVDSGDAVAFCRQIVLSLIHGPVSGLARTIPVETEIRAVFIDGRTAYVDLSREVAASHPGGIVSELMTVYSIVNTLVLNVDGVDQVKLLIEGQETETLAGHIDIRFPLNADMLIIR